MHTLIMTGATRGIGRVAATEVLRKDQETHLVLLGRGESGRNTLDELRAISDNVTLVDTDLASIDGIRSSAETVNRMLDQGDLPPLRAFAGNAGVQFVDALHATPDGYETTFAVNVLANHLLLRAFEPRFSAPARIVITVSDTHFGDFRHTGGLVPAPRWSDPETLARPGAFPKPATVTAGRTAYSTSKLAAIHLVHEWARRLPDGVDIVSYNPGLVPGTGLVRSAGPIDRFLSRRVLPALSITPIVDTVPAAGRKLADAILGRTAAPTGSYIDRSRAVPSSKESYDPDREHRLWDFAEHARKDG
ncbi:MULTISPECIES: SDR family NAD(P)-dependent oxidoreductase [Thermomonosporaceae]|uniref:SDR family NAD(P)-dependent oxidoreductase n=1 Tax=Thermomonosporaceae TaxID=2012 RepID=UPI00255A9531|nr:MULTISPECIES: SDR family NAD(P)-dependent oxidoreductase [Thermomonosporaceae]MDL4773104.1 SDR family NAD(P)-dependent oxidoreductase [Actinomadura xylanilytica]